MVPNMPLILIDNHPAFRGRREDMIDKGKTRFVSDEFPYLFLKSSISAWKPRENDATIRVKNHDEV